MKTVNITIKNIKTGKRGNAIALLDTGAKRTYISTEKAESLGLDVGSEKRVKFHTFGTSNSSDMTTRKTKFSIVQINGFNTIVDAKIVSVITASMIKQKLNLDKYRNNCKNLSMVDIPRQHSYLHRCINR